MKTDKELSAAAKRYAEAHASHYTDRDLLVALRSYESVIALDPNTLEADYSRTQIRNIVRQVVPAIEVLAAQIKLVLRHLMPDGDQSTAAT